MRSGVFILYILLVLLSELPAQKRACSMHHRTQLQKKTDQNDFTDKLKNIIAYSSSTEANKAGCSTPLIIPMAVHFINMKVDHIPCLKRWINTQIVTLNLDFGGSDEYENTWSNMAKAPSKGNTTSNPCFVFCLAKTGHPQGYGLINGQPAITYNRLSSYNNADWSGYLNIYITNLEKNELGFSPLGGEGNGDGVVIDAKTFGIYDLACNPSGVQENKWMDSHALSHEIGHYLFLNHIWAGTCKHDPSSPKNLNQVFMSYGLNACAYAQKPFMKKIGVFEACMTQFDGPQRKHMRNYAILYLQEVIERGRSSCN